MFNEETNVGMQIKQNVDESSMPVNDGFENPYVDNASGEQNVQQNQVHEEPTMPPIILYRSKEGIQRWMSEQEIGQTLAQSKGVACDDAFLEKHKDEIKGYVEKQPEGVEISSVFDIIEPGDSINHQTVISVGDRQIELEYFGKRSTLSRENEIFSILIKEEIDEWKKGIKECTPESLFSDNTPEMLTLFRSMELLCMNIDMEECNGLYCTSTDVTSQRLIGMMSASLRKPIYDNEQDVEGKKIVSFSLDYPGKVEVPKQATHLYHLSLFNSQNIDIYTNDRVVIC